jgi:hypothetical protein
MDLKNSTMSSFWQISTFKVKPALGNSTLGTSFSPEGNNAISAYKDSPITVFDH